MKVFTALLLCLFYQTIYAALPPNLPHDGAKNIRTQSEMSELEERYDSALTNCSIGPDTGNSNINCDEIIDLKNPFKDIETSNTATQAERDNQILDREMTLSRLDCAFNNSSGVAGLSCGSVSNYISSNRYGRGDVKVLERVERIFMGMASSWGDTMTGYAKNLFLILASICIVKQFGFLALKRADLGEFFAELIKFTVTLGFFWWLLDNGPEFAKAIIDSLKQIAEAASASV